METPDETTLAWVEEIVGPFTILSRFAHSHGYSRLWRLDGEGKNVWLKMHTHPHKWAGEVHALTLWTPSLGHVPRLLAARSDPNAVLLSEVEGKEASLLPLDSPSEDELWREAGAWLRTLHEKKNDWFGNVTAAGLAHDRPSFDAGSFLALQWEERIAKAWESGLLDQAEIDFVAGTMGEGLSFFAEERATAIHRDYTPRNWMASPQGRLTAVIDFEHARWDVRAADLQRPWSREFLRNPALIEAFYEGYGELTDLLRAQIETMRTVMALTTIVWATGVGDTDFAQEGRDDLRRLMAQR